MWRARAAIVRLNEAMRTTLILLGALASALLVTSSASATAEANRRLLQYGSGKEFAVQTITPWSLGRT